MEYPLGVSSKEVDEMWVSGEEIEKLRKVDLTRLPRTVQKRIRNDPLSFILFNFLHEKCRFFQLSPPRRPRMLVAQCKSEEQERPQIWKAVRYAAVTLAKKILVRNTEDGVRSVFGDDPESDVVTVFVVDKKHRLYFELLDLITDKLPPPSPRENASELALSTFKTREGKFLYYLFFPRALDDQPLIKELKARGYISGGPPYKLARKSLREIREFLKGRSCPICGIFLDSAPKKVCGPICKSKKFRLFRVLDRIYRKNPRIDKEQLVRDLTNHLKKQKEKAKKIAEKKKQPVMWVEVQHPEKVVKQFLSSRLNKKPPRKFPRSKSQKKVEISKKTKAVMFTEIVE